MKSPIFSKEKLLYFPKKSGIVPIFRKSPSSYISYFCEYTPCDRDLLLDMGMHLGPFSEPSGIFSWILV